MGQEEIRLLGAARTPIGALGGAFRRLSALQLGAVALSGLGERLQLEPSRVSALFLGTLFGAGLGPNPAQRVAHEAGLGDDVLCASMRAGPGSSLLALISAAGTLQGDDIALVGGCDSASTQPYFMPNARFGSRLGGSKILDGAQRDAWTGEDDVPLNVTSALQAQRLGLEESARDAWSASQSIKALAGLVPVEVFEGKGVQTIELDEAPNPSPTPWLASLGDGAAAIAISRVGDGPRLLGWARAGVEPNHSPLAPLEAAEKLLKKLDLSAEKVSVFEVDDSLGVAAWEAARRFGLADGRLNPYGGALRRGAPGAACGAIALTHLERSLGEHGGVGLIAYGTGAGGAIALAFSA